MWTTLRARLLATYAGLILAVLVAVALGMLAYLWRNPLAQRQAFLRLSVAADAAVRRLDTLGFAEGHQRPDLDQVALVLRRLGQALEARFLLVAPDSRVVIDTRPEIPFQPPLGRRWEGMARDAQGRAWLYVNRTLPSGLTLVAAAPRPKRLHSLWVLFRDEMIPPLAQAALLALGLALILALALSRWVARPLDRMAEAARALAAGEHRLIPEEGPAEVQALARAFNEMSRQVQASQQSQRDFVANVSHELKTPLTSIQGFAQAILDGTAEDPQSVQQAARVIHDEAERMHRLVLDLLELARLDAGTADLRHEPVALADLVQAVLERMMPQARQARVTLEAQVWDEITLLGDGDRLAQVLLNLLDNALKHTPAGGRVTVQVRARGAWAEIRVQDTGEGIPPEVLPRIFERFYQQDQARRGGVGLGLSIAYEIVRAHGGTIEAQSTPGKGSTFVVKLPRVPQTGAPAPP